MVSTDRQQLTGIGVVVYAGKDAHAPIMARSRSGPGGR